MAVGRSIHPGHASGEMLEEQLMMKWPAEFHAMVVDQVLWRTLTD